MKLSTLSLEEHSIGKATVLIRDITMLAYEVKILERHDQQIEGKGKKAKCFITERSRGVVSWIRFGIEGMVKLLMGVEECCKTLVSASRTFAWRENGRSFRLERKENNAGRFLLCSVTDGEGKKHWLVFQERRGFLNGWTTLAEKIRGMGFKPRQENIPMRIATVDPSKGGRKVYKSR